eukprot:TRINITY_DN42868_c0_g1_i1.p1 TRINITY_DN42868_c0_g1~~TRINITY_DN42868_c0_g1_i1.p1  ORF type:complete len:193 (-),score=34.20 TRINITY_DN42868_c0_g1_i1:50-628(-)
MNIDRTIHPSGIVPTVTNVVATSSLGCKLDLKYIALHARNAQYNPKRFPPVIVRQREPKSTALIFSSGKMVCTGSRSDAEAKLASRKFARTVRKLVEKADDIKFNDFKIQNVVASADVKFPVKLEALQIEHSAHASYEPELFPGLVYRMLDPKVVLLIFVSGKIVLTGAKSREHIYQAFENIYPVLQEFRKV